MEDALRPYVVRVAAVRDFAPLEEVDAFERKKSVDRGFHVWRSRIGATIVFGFS